MAETDLKRYFLGGAALILLVWGWLVIWPLAKPSVTTLGGSVVGAWHWADQALFRSPPSVRQDLHRSYQEARGSMRTVWGFSHRTFAEEVGWHRKAGYDAPINAGPSWRAAYRNRFQQYAEVEIRCEADGTFIRYDFEDPMVLPYRASPRPGASASRKTFAFRPVGDAGRDPLADMKQSIAEGTITVPECVVMASHADPFTALCGLAGLRLLRAAEFVSAAQRLEDDDRSVRYGPGGCCSCLRSVAHVIVDLRTWSPP